MGALTRATRNELAENVAGDAAWWEDRFAEIGGGKSLKEICAERGWAYGEVYRTIRADEGLSAAYDAAKRGQAELLVDGAVGDVMAVTTADEVPVGKLKADVALRVAGKWDRDRYGEKVEVRGGLLVGTVSDALRAISERKQAALRDQMIDSSIAGQAKLVTQTPVESV